MRSSRDRADQAYARFASAKAELLDSVAELATTKTWQGDGSGNLASWLAARWQIPRRVAAEYVREAEVLKARPALAEALASGSISIEQCKALTVLSKEDADDDQAWLEVLPFWSYPELEREARKQTARELERADGGVYLRMRHTDDERFVRGDFQLKPEDGAVLLAAIDARIRDGTKLRDWDRASAGALVELAKDSAKRTTVLLSVSEDVLAGADGVASLDSNTFVGSQTAQRLACDASVQILYKDEDGKITAIGKMSPTVPPHLRRAVFERDEGMCVFEGCELREYLEVHHIVPVAEGGLTVLTNLLLVCWNHHELLHEGGWAVTGEAGPKITWVRPDGTPHQPRVRVTLDTS